MLRSDHSLLFAHLKDRTASPWCKVSFMEMWFCSVVTVYESFVLGQRPCIEEQNWEIIISIIICFNIVKGYTSR